MNNPFTGRTLVLDGAMGTLLQQRNFSDNSVLWSAGAIQKYPERILEIHTEYLLAGADIITTNTFRTNPVSVRAAGINGLSSKTLATEAAAIAKKAVAGSSALVAGSNPPAEDCYQRERKLTGAELEFNHRNHIEWLAGSGVDLILNETQSHMDEIRIICKCCSHLDIPFVISLYLDESGRLLSGEDPNDAISEIMYFNPTAIGFNCVKPELFQTVFAMIEVPAFWGLYLNCGLGEHTDETVKECLTPELYANEIRKYLQFKPAFAGGCCGSTPKHIAALRRVLNEENNN